MEKVIEFLRKNNVCTVATSSKDKPRASVLEYYMVGDAVIFATDGDSIKATNIASNNHISVSVHRMPQFVTIDGSVTQPTQDEIEGYSLQLLTNHPEFVAMIESGMMKPFTHYKLIFETVFFNDFSQGMRPPEIIKL